MIKAATNLQSHATSNVANVSQRAALAAVSGDLSAVAEMRAAFERRGHTMHQLLTGIEGVTSLEPQGAFYAFPNLSHYLGPLDPRPHVHHHHRAVHACCSTRPRWPSCPGRRSTRPATPA